MRHSKYEEVKGPKISDKEGIYPESVLKLLDSRLMSHHTPSTLKEGELYDVVCSDGSTQLGQK